MKIKFTLALLLVTAISGFAQTDTPYSRFGYGMLGENATSMQSQMGGVGYAMQSGRQINAMNPASYASTDSLTFLFDMGVSLNNVWRSEKDAKDHRIGGGLDYITMQFPLCKFMGMSIGLLPWSSVGYSFGTEIKNGTSSHNGSGGFNTLYAGVSGKIPGGLSLGFNISYLFGTNYNDVYAYTTSSSVSLFELVTQVRDFNFDIGLQYNLKITPEHSLTAGATFSPGKTFLGHSWIQKYDVGHDTDPDTIGYTSLKDKVTRPYKIGVGIAYNIKNKLFAEVDFSYQPWSKAKIMSYETFATSKFTDRYKIAAGLSYTPAIRGNYLQRMSYRFGAHYTQDYIMVGENKVKEWGLSLGFGLPAPGQKTVINLGFEYIHRQCSPQSLLTENYFNIKLGINFNQLWFMQSKLR
ncbi:MAG: hypothetical protein HUK13_08260 [Muribaculaceae bacterium]|nr:hypothetical protein [Muribaculaceae bacterium]